MQPAIDFDNSYARLPDRFFARLGPTPVPKPDLIRLNIDLAEELGLNSVELSSEAGISMLAGNHMPDGAEPLAMAYAGQQFGNWVPQLGDGRALLLGEVIDRNGIRRDIQLKGSGPTPFSRMGDGRAWLGPVLREYIVSEAMAALGVPTTRALAAVSTGETIFREQKLPGAVLTRVATSHLRVGTFQYFAARHDEDGLKLLADYAIDRLHPGAREKDNPYVGLLEAVIQVQAELVANWMNLGFIHGVMNTDNVSIAGETIDYGPCAFMDEFHPDRVFSSIDEMGRYAYSNQPRIAHWNLVQLAQSLLPLLGETQELAVAAAQEAIDAFPAVYEHLHQPGFNAKLGLGDVKEGDAELGNDLLKIMAEQKADFTLIFRHLASGDRTQLKAELDDADALDNWLDRWQARSEGEKNTAEERGSLMLAANPAFIPRNHRIEQAIRAGLEDDFQPFERLVKVLKNPFEDQPEHAELMLGPNPKEIVRYTFCGT